MICPVKNCRSDIDDDSRFCDQCGSEILMCPKCGAPGTGKFCAKDGNRLERKGSAAPAQRSAGSVAQVQPDAAHQQPAAQAPAAADNSRTGDVTFNTAAEKMILVHSSGVRLELSGGDILGRNEGPHAPALGAFSFISRRHAQVEKTGTVWMIKDLGSKNKTRVNGSLLEPEKAVPLNQGDTVILADQEFTML